MRWRHLSPVAVAALGGLVACAGSDLDVATNGDAIDASDADSPTASAVPSVPDTVTGSATMATTPATATSPESRASELCSYQSTIVLGQVANPALDETSGLVASRRHPDVIWASNDGSRAPGVFALGRDGADLGFHRLDVDGVIDIEDIAMISGPAGDEVLLADIGDNTSERSSIRIYRFAEPDPAVVAPITDVEVLEYVYPDRPHNAEVLLVDETSQRIVIVTKEQRPVEGLPPDLGPTEPSFVFEGAVDAIGDGPTELTAAGMLDAPRLETRTVTESPQPVSLLGIGGLPTGGDMSPDGSLIALRTYETIWVWSRPPGSAVAESLTSEPCQAGTIRERQGEAVAFFDGSLITASEGQNPELLQLRP